MALRPVPPLRWVVALGLFAAATVYVVVSRSNDPAAGPRAVASPSPAATSHGDGLSDSHDGYLMTPVTLPTVRGAAVPVAFRILGPDGAAETGYEIVQTKPLHMYLIRDDLSGYQHLHPQLTGDTWTATVNVPDGGGYRVYAEFTPKARAGSGHPTVLGVPFVVTGDTTLARLPVPAASASVDGYTVTRLDGTANLIAGRSAILRFQVRDASGAPVAALERYLGVFAHVSAFDVFSQGLTHLHPAVPADGRAPADGVLTFHAQFPNRGQQRLFLQFQTAGAGAGQAGTAGAGAGAGQAGTAGAAGTASVVHQVAFTVLVT